MISTNLLPARASARALLSRWAEFERNVPNSSKVTGVLYHGDVDGAIGAAGALLRLGSAVQTKSFWISTEDYDFASAHKWAGSARLSRLAVIDLGLENNAQALTSIAGVVTGPLFLYDHHVVSSGAVYPPNVVLANPTPHGHSMSRLPVPSFVFADELLRERGLALPEWLLLVALFAEGVDQFFPDDVTRMLAECCEERPHPTPRDAFRRTPLSRLPVLIRAAFTVCSNNDHRVVEALSASISSSFTPSDLTDELQREFGTAAKELSNSIRNEVDRWAAKLRGADPKTPFVIRMASAFPIAGPVASILRGRLNATIVGIQERDGRVSIELRAPNDSTVNFPSMLEILAGLVPLLHHGGHRTAAGAAVRPEDAESFVAHFMQTYRDVT